MEGSHQKLATLLFFGYYSSNISVKLFLSSLFFDVNSLFINKTMIVEKTNKRSTQWVSFVLAWWAQIHADNSVCNVAKGNSILLPQNFCCCIQFCHFVHFGFTSFWCPYFVWVIGPHICLFPVPKPQSLLISNFPLPFYSC